MRGLGPPLYPRFAYCCSESFDSLELDDFKQQFNGLDVDHDGIISNPDLVESLCLEPSTASEMIVHLNKGRKEAKHISFDRFLESRMKYHLSSNASSIFYDIMEGRKAMAPLAGFDSCESASNGSSPPPSPQYEAKSGVEAVEPTESFVSQPEVVAFALNQFPFKIEIGDSALEDVFVRYGTRKGMLSSEEFEETMKVRCLGDALGMNCSH